jgi:drug/metabolite transporter (DMT)-like permease
MSHKTKVWLAMMALYIIWGSTYLGIRYAVMTIPPFMMAGVRFAISGSMLFVWRRMAGDPMPTLNQWKSALIVGLLLLLGGNGVLGWAERLIPSGVAALLIGAVPMMLVLIEGLRPGGVKPTWRQIFGLLIGFGGIAILIGPAEFTGGGQEINLLGVGACLIASLLWAIGSIYNRTADLPESTTLFTGMEMLMGSAGLIAFGLVSGELNGFRIEQVSIESLIGLIYLITFGSLIGFVSYAWAIRNAPVSLVATYAYVNPIVAVLLGNLIASEPLDSRVLIAALIIVGSVIFINSSKKSKVIQEDEVNAVIAD